MSIKINKQTNKQKQQDITKYVKTIQKNDKEQQNKAKYDNNNKHKER